MRIYDPSNDELQEINKHLMSGLIKVDGLEPDTDDIRFYCKDGYTISMFHLQDCCESVYLESADSLENSSDIYTDCDWCELERVDSDRGPLNEYEDSYTWTFYKVKTNKGYDTLRWYGYSNGYYSESVDFDISA